MLVSACINGSYKKSNSNKTYIPFPEPKELQDSDKNYINKTEKKKQIENWKESNYVLINIGIIFIK